MRALLRGLTRRRLAAVGLLAVVAGLMANSVRATATAPTGGGLPNFFGPTATEPHQDSAPSQWAYTVTSGGVAAGQTVTFAFLYNGKPGDRTHAVSFDSIYNAEVKSEVRIAPVPAGLPVLPSNQCVNPGNAPAFTAVPNPYTQTLDVQVSSAISPGPVIYCFSGNLVGFPVSPGQGYSIGYTEPGGTAPPVAYTVLAASGGTTEQVAVSDPGDSGRDITDAGLGGSNIGLFSRTYTLTLTASPGATYFFTGQAYDTVAFTPDRNPDTKVSIYADPPSLPVVGCSAGESFPGTFCTDNTTGIAVGHLTVTSTNPNADYVSIKGNNQSGSSTETEPSRISITVGPAGSSGPVGTPKATPTPNGGGNALPTFDVGCNGSLHPLALEHGLGSVEFADLYGKALLPAALQECQALRPLLSFFGVTDDVGLETMFGSSDSPFAYVGTDRAMSSQETAADTPAGSTISQIPVALEPIVVTYNLAGCNTGTLQLRSQVLSAIMLGKITTWNNPLLLQDNGGPTGGLASCNLPILVAHDIGPTSSILKDYLSKRLPAWVPYRQQELNDSWPGGAPVACTANSSRPMAMCVASQPGMIGYGFYRDIAASGLPIADVDNPSGFYSYTKPDDVLTGCTNAAGTDQVQNPAVPAQVNGNWNSQSITDTTLPNSYPICTFDFVVAATNCRDPHTLSSYQSLVALLDAGLSEYGQSLLPGAGFAKLPGSINNLSQSGTNQLACP